LAIINNFGKIILLLIFLLFTYCDEKDQIVDIIPTEEISGKTKINYTFLGKTPFYKQSNILCKFEEELLIFGTYKPIHIYNLISGTWTTRDVPSKEYGRWDGAAFKHGESIYYFGSSIPGVVNDIVKYNPSKDNYERTNLVLPKYYSYPAYGIQNDKFIFLSSMFDTIYVFNPVLKQLKKITPNPFYVTNQTVIFCAGVYQNYFYVFGNTGSSSRGNSFLRMNLINNEWEEISIPSALQLSYVFGGACGDKMIIFQDTTAAYTYSFSTKEWAIDKSNVPVFHRLLNGQLISGEWSIYPADSCLYGSEVYSQKLWKISVK
jgi:hypothetical protein